MINKLKIKNYKSYEDFELNLNPDLNLIIGDKLEYNDLDIYITDLQATFLNGCDQMKATIKGWVKSDSVLSGNYVITKNNINGFYYNNLVFYFDDINESVDVYDNDVLIHSNLKAPYICSDLMCFLTYNQAKKYLLSL